MQRILATLVGVALAAGLVIANTPEAVAQSPKELVNRFLNAGDDPKEAMALANNFAPDATHKVTLIMGHGMKDEHLTYKLSSWSHRDNWRDDPEVAKLLQGYRETEHSTPVISVEKKDGTSIVTAVQDVKYMWNEHQGEMKLTNRFHISEKTGKPVALRLESVFDYH